MASLRMSRALLRGVLVAAGALLLGGLGGCVVHGHGCAPFVVDVGYVHHHGHHGHGHGHWHGCR